jgi:pilus assembly protein CpaF
MINSPFSLKEKILQHHAPIGSANFFEYIEQLKRDLRDELAQKDEHYLEMNGKALIGEPTAVAYFLTEIERYMRRLPFNGELPAVYRNQIEGIFQEWKGFGPAYRWFTDRKFSDSSGLQIIGKQIFITRKGEYELYPFEMSSLERVEQLKRAILKNDPRIKIDSSNPSAELKMDDPLWPGRFIRIAIWNEPRVWKEFLTITMRRQIVEYLSLEDQAGTGSIPAEAIIMLQNLFQTYRNTVIAGPVGSGKSTFANTVVGEQLMLSTGCQGVIMIEKHPESILPYVVKGHRIIPINAKEEELMEVGVESLRHDPRIIYMTEMRYHEWEFFNFAAEKGHEGLIGTYHTKDAEDIPYQGGFAVYSRLGGSLQANILSTLNSCELVIIMEGRDKGKKRLTRISEICYDPEGARVYANDLMRWDPQTDTWSYNDNVSESMVEKMGRKNKPATDLFCTELKRLTNHRKISNPIKYSLKAELAIRG